MPVIQGTKIIGATQFRKNAIPKEAGRDEWTKTPNSNGKLTTKEKKEQDRQKVLNVAEWERNQIQMDKMKNLKRFEKNIFLAVTLENQIFSYKDASYTFF